MRYEGVVYRPPSEANSLLIQATIGCPHNKCTFCPMYKGVRFKVRSVADIKEDLRMASAHYGDRIESIFFPDGNTIILKTDQLVEILNYTRELFPSAKRITMYGSARFINLKSAEDLIRLKQAGLNRIHSGMESGDDEVLTAIKKGATAKEIIEAGLKVKQANIEQSEYVLIGVGGRERSKQHAIESARVLSEIDPDFIRVRTFCPIPGTPLYDDYHQGKFGLLQPHEALREMAMLIENLNCTSKFYCDHYNNYANVNGQLPQDKPAMLHHIERLLTIPEDNFRPPEEGGL